MKRFLKFKNSTLENSFIKEYNERSLSGMRLGYWLAIILFGLFGFLDALMMPSSFRTILTIRFGLVIPLTFTFFILSYVKSLRKYMQLMVSFNAVVMGLSIVAMIAIADANEPGFKFYYAGLMLVIMGISSLFRLRFFYALISSSLIIMGYEMTAVFIQKISDISSFNSNYMIFISSNFFFISANIVGLLAAYYLEYYMRIEFVQQEEIVEKHQHLSILMKNMKTELELARHIQSNLLPSVCPYLNEMKIHSLYKPMEELGGDFYDYIRFVERNLVGIFISDVSGHGIPAALITSMLKTLNITAGSSKFDPSGFLKYINLHLIDQIGDNYLTAIYMLYNSETKEIKFSRAGHPYPLLIRNGRIEHLTSKGGVIGMYHGVNYEVVSLILEHGDKILLYTDGLTEEINSDKEMFEDTYFNEVLPSIADRSIDDIISCSYQKLIEYKGDDKLNDDVCLVGIEIL
jgi:serine phosphatase RsbU (regulator of sigma subunit)